MAPQAGQIDKVGANSRSQTGQFIRLGSQDLTISGISA
jgi:hypothetical protein